MPVEKLSKQLPEIRTKEPDTKVIKLTAEARAGLKRIGPSDKRLQIILNSAKLTHTAKDHEQRWMAAFILEAQGYNLERE